MKYCKIICLAVTICILAGCGRNKSYRNPDELQDVRTSVSEVSDGTEENIGSSGTNAESHDTGDADEVILDHLVSNGKPSIVDFTASWCGPCQRMKPVFHRLAKDFRDEYNFITIDIDANPELAEKYQVQAVPTFVFLDADGIEGNRITGMVDESDFRNELLEPAWY